MVCLGGTTWTWTGQTGLQWAGTAGTLAAMSKVARSLSRDPDETFPAWQGMQYFASMFSGHAQLRHVDNDRYGPHAWTSVRDVLGRHVGGAPVQGS